MASTAADRRPLSARSVIASTLLGMQPPRLDTLTLVRSGELFGIAEGTTRVALSRMVAAGELEADGGGYRLAGSLILRQSRQEHSRSGAPDRRWRGGWRTAVVTAGARSAEQRTALRRAMANLRMAEVRDGVWMRPDNLAAPVELDGTSLGPTNHDGGHPEDEAAAVAQCLWFSARLADPAMSDRQLAVELWNLAGWAEQANRLGDETAALLGDLRGGRTDALAPAFEVSAAVLRHFQADPLLPAALLPEDWPGTRLRADYDQYDTAFKALWRAWFQGHRSPADVARPAPGGGRRS